MWQKTNEMVINPYSIKNETVWTILLYDIWYWTLAIPMHTFYVLQYWCQWELKHRKEDILVGFHFWKLLSNSKTTKMFSIFVEVRLYFNFVFRKITN